jgi:sugar phosphate isomerase/epimerase
MKLDARGVHLTYCSNIHPGETWTEVRANLERYVPAVRDRVASGHPFGMGLRLSAEAARALSAPAALEEFRDFMQRNQLYVFTINGFPYGAFHGTPVKADVYLPDWRDEERLRYTNELAELLAKLLPDDAELEGSVSTVPGAYKPLIRSVAEVEHMADRMLRHVARLVEIEAQTGKRIALAIEPEPHCYLETIEETARFFEDRLFCDAAVQRLSDLTGLGAAEAAKALHDHIGVCLDLCHAAVEFENAADCVKRLDEAKIRIIKVQISAGLRLRELTPDALQALRQFDDGVYLHQVVESGPAGVTRFADLPDAFASLHAHPHTAEWRVHFHVPIFLDRLEAFSSTRDFVEDVLLLHRHRPLSRHLEVETYTWNVLPPQMRTEAMEDAIARELNWVRETLAA